jgi:DNA repair protein RadD
MRVDYRINFREYKSEWVCFEHDGYARQKAVAWWRQRSREPIPETVEQAVRIANNGGLASTIEITVRSVEGEKFDRITKYELGPVPEKADVPDTARYGCSDDWLAPDEEYEDWTYPSEPDTTSDDEIPF